jgi:hypothetical protein
MGFTMTMLKNGKPTGGDYRMVCHYIVDLYQGRRRLGNYDHRVIMATKDDSNNLEHMSWMQRRADGTSSNRSLWF